MIAKDRKHWDVLLVRETYEYQRIKSLPNNFFINMFVKVCNNMFQNVQIQLPWKKILICIIQNDYQISVKSHISAYRNRFNDYRPRCQSRSTQKLYCSLCFPPVQVDCARAKSSNSITTKFLELCISISRPSSDSTIQWPFRVTLMRDIDLTILSQFEPQLLSKTSQFFYIC